jgi:hypothetical protein
MDAQLVFDTAVTLCGIVLTTATGAWVLVLGYRSRYPARVRYVHGSLASLFVDDVSDLPQVQLSISFQGISISGRAAVLRGAFENCGHKDLTAAMVESPISIRLTPGLRWLEVSGITASPRLEPHVSIRYDPEAAEVSFGPLFRRGEWLAFSALLEMDSNRSVEFPLSFEHRIADLRPIERAKAPVRWRMHVLTVWAFVFPVLVALANPRTSPRTALRIYRWMEAVAHDPRIVAIDRFSTVHKQGLYALLGVYAVVGLSASAYALYSAFRRRDPDPNLPPERRPDPGLPSEFRGT